MKIKKLLELLKKEDPDQEVAVWLAGKDGWEIVEIGVGDAIVGTFKDGCVLLPVEIPEELLEWNKGSDQEPAVLKEWDKKGTPMSLDDLPDIEAEA